MLKLNFERVVLAGLLIVSQKLMPPKIHLFFTPLWLTLIF